MPPLSDLHVHSTCSGDGRSTVSEMCGRAIELGLERIAFTEHVDFEPGDPHYGFYDYDRHRAEVEAARGRFGRRLAILLGIEVDYQPQYHEDTLEFLDQCDFDLVMGAVHYVENRVLDSREFLRRPQHVAYADYFRAVEAAAHAQVFDVMAHVDYCKRYGHPVHGGYDPQDFRDEVRDMLHALLETGTGLEINTSGLRHPPREAYPPLAVVRWYGEMGGERVCLGSDGHDAEQLGHGLEEGLHIAQEAGFTRWEGGWLVGGM